MQHVSNIISGEYLVFEAGELLKKSQHIKCFRMLNRHIVDPDFIRDAPDIIQVQIQITRRLLHCCNRLLRKYLNKYAEKSHKIHPLLTRTIELSLYMQLNLQNYKNSLNGVHIDYGTTTLMDSPSNKRKQMFREFAQEQMTLTAKLQQFADFEIPDEYVPKTSAWFDNQCFSFYQCLCDTLLMVYIYEKRIRNQGANVELQMLLKLMTNQYTNLKSIQLRSACMMQLGNAYFEICEFNKAEAIYMDSFQIASVGVCQILADVEKLKRNVNEPLLVQQMTKLLSQMAIGLECISMLNTHTENYHRCLETYHLATHLTKIFGFFNKAKELQAFITKQTTRYQEKYQLYVQENVEIYRFLKELYIQDEDPQLAQMKQEFNQSQYAFTQVKPKQEQQMNITQDQSKIFIIRKDLPPRPITGKQQQAQFFIKNQSVKSLKSKKLNNNSMQSIDQPSTNFADSQLHSPPRQDKSFSRIGEGTMQSFYQGNSTDLKPNQEKGKNFLSELINMRNQQHFQSNNHKKVKETELEKNYRLNKELLHKMNNRCPYTPLDQMIGKYIDANLSSHQKCSSLQEIKVSAKDIITIEQEVHKEVPITKSLFHAKKITSSDGVYVKEKEALFNKHFEFNVIEYFDFVTTQKDSAVSQIKASQRQKQAKIAQQSLFNENFVPKRRVNSTIVDDNKQQIESTKIAQQAQNLINKAKPTVPTRPPQPRLSMVSFLQDLPIETQSENKEVDQTALLEAAKGSIMNTISKNEGEKKYIEQEDLELRATGLPCKYKRSRSSKLQDKVEFRSILKMSELNSLGKSTKYIRDKQTTTEINELSIKQWASKDKIK